MTESAVQSQLSITRWILTSLKGEAEWRTSVWSKRIPSLMALAVVSLGIVFGSLVIRTPNRSAGIVKAATGPKQVQVTNQSSTGFTVSWLTDTPTIGFVKLQGPEPNLFFDDRDLERASVNDYTHHITIRGLEPDKLYRFQIGSGGRLYNNDGQPYQGMTTKESPRQTQADPAYGQVVTANGEPAEGAIVYLTLQGGSPLSTLVSKQGTWLISLNRSWTADLSSLLSYPSRGARFDLIVDNGRQRSVGEILTGFDEPVPLITLGEDFSYTDLSKVVSSKLQPPVTPTPAPFTGEITPDLNGDGVVNTSDLGRLRQALAQASQDRRYDLNQDGKIDDADIQALLDNWGTIK